MITRIKRALLCIGFLGLALGIAALGLRFGREARAQEGAAGGPKAVAKGKSQDVDRDAVTKTVQSFTAAFEKGDAKALAAHWTENGEYVADDGTTIRGRAAIEKAYAGILAKRKGPAKVQIEVDSIRFPSKDTAIEEGHFKVSVGKSQGVTNKYSVLHVRENGKWLMALVREWPSEGVSLRDLDWLIGTWSAKREDVEVLTKYEWWGGKNFIRMEITIKGNKKTTTGVQMIGKDASTGEIRSWTFDPDGSFSSANWSRDGKKWVLDSAAVMTTGEIHTATNILLPVDENTFTFQSVRRAVGDTELPDIGPVRVTRVKTNK